MQKIASVRLCIILGSFLVALFLLQENKANFKTASVENSQYDSSRVLVRYKNQASIFGKSNLINILNKKQRTVISSETILPQLDLWHLSPDVSSKELAESLSKHPLIQYAEPDYIVYTMGGEKKKKQDTTIPLPAEDNVSGPDPKLTNSYGLLKIEAPKAWEIHRGTSEVIIAIIDSGIDYRHDDLSTNLWYNTGEVGSYEDDKNKTHNRQTDGIDNDGNGYIDDVIGWDFRNNDGKPYDDNDHGTHVAGIAGAIGDNSLGSSGVTKDVRLMILKFIHSDGSGKVSDAIKAISYAIKNGAKVLSNSWGGASFSQSLQEAIVLTAENNMLFVAAAGNGGDDSKGDNIDKEPVYPAAFDLSNIISVAATNRSDKLEFFSNYGSTNVDFAAPGADIFSTLPNNKYGNFSGTSMATPYVAGAAALLLGFNSNLTTLEIKQALMDSVDPLAGLKNKTVTGGRLNVYKAIQVLQSNKILLGKEE
ncbi:MAG: S8 family serine peptidase [Deltaproteobacteria bacterium]|nr:S8 family serine peptidase [Deltaproteobacteria bacterium]